ncbi:MAG TPA: deoxyuridine 5'-triphosphate nucleotidohydrolase [Thermomicrobiales bacterium]|nr:deoxyuridine 5'-triphosphate nucleotidohydrolase [Thermomicrobiales bacterium]
MTTPRALDGPGSVLSGDAIRIAISEETPLLRDFKDLESQVQPNGFDLTLASVSRHLGSGSVGQSNTDRILPDLEDLAFDANGWLHLDPGCYHITYNEVVALPLNLMALGRPRSTLARIGATIHTAVWDAGYEGRSTSLLAVLNPNGIRLQRDARVMQLVFMTIANPQETGYSGRYQGEGVHP